MEHPFEKSNPVYKAIMDIYRSNPNIYSLDRGSVVSALDRSKLVQPRTFKGSMHIKWKQNYRDYWREGQYLGRVTVDEGEVIDMRMV